MTKEKKRPLMILMAVILVGILGVLLSHNSKAEEARRLQEQLDLGNKYLAEMNYEEAVVAFHTAIEIEPMSAEAYLGLADAYVGMGDPESALATLEKGYELTKDQRLSAKINELTVQIERDGVVQPAAETESVVVEPAVVVMSGRREQPFYERIYTVEEEIALGKLIQALQNEDVEGVLNCGVYELPRNFENTGEYIHGVFGDYAVEVYWDTNDSDNRSFSGDIYALTDGEFGYSFIVGSWNNRIFKIPCKNGSYHGEFAGMSKISSEVEESYFGTMDSGVIVTADMLVKVETQLQFPRLDGSVGIETVVRETTTVEVRDGRIQQLSTGGGYGSSMTDESGAMYWEANPTSEEVIGKEAYIRQGQIMEIQ
ncbi:MAG: tetratricopeptide repeat protein [Lachnospiraceae bacterium]|nr:tetratricopeptide repeat protein [Lachnospiraceae bacterium]